MKRAEICLFGLVLFLAGSMAGLGCEQWGLAHYPEFFCGPLITGHTAMCPKDRP